MFAFGGVWKGISVGEMYPLDPADPLTLESGSSSIGVIGGGGVSGGDGEATGVSRNGDDSAGAEVESLP